MVTAAGSGYSNCSANAVTRWREDVTRDNWGTFVYLRDVRSGGVWSAGYQPVQRRPQSYEVSFSEDKADFWRVDAGITTHMEIVVSAEDNAELRRISLTNNSTRTREIELTSYAEVVLATPQADAAHPAFSLSRPNSWPVRMQSWPIAGNVQALTSRSGEFTSSWSKEIWLERCSTKLTAGDFSAAGTPPRIPLPSWKTGHSQTQSVPC